MYLKHIIWTITKHFVWTLKYPNVYFLSFKVRVALEARVWEKGKGRQGIFKKKTDLVTSPYQKQKPSGQKQILDIQYFVQNNILNNIKH